MEIEAKFRIRGLVEPSRIEALDMAPYRLGPRVEHDLLDRILDTPDYALIGHRYALRVRQDGDALILTLKEPGSVQGETHRRREWEEPLSVDQIATVADWPASIRDRVQDIIGSHSLEEIVQVRNQRHSWELRLDDHLIGELALDLGTIRAGTNESPMHEIEFELKAQGTEQHLTTVIGLLTSQLPLEAESRSKLERGLALLER